LPQDIRPFLQYPPNLYGVFLPCIHVVACTPFSLVMFEELSINVIIDQNIDLSLELRAKRGCTIKELKNDLVSKDPTGCVRADKFGLSIAPGDCGPMLSDDVLVGREHQTLHLCEIVAQVASQERLQIISNEANRRVPHDILVCLSSLDGMEEVYQIDNSSSDWISIGALRGWLGVTYKLRYSEKLRFGVAAAATTVLPLCNDDVVPTSPNEITIQGPGSVVQMLLMALRRNGTMKERRPCQLLSSQLTAVKQVPQEIAPEFVSLAAFAQNLSDAGHSGPLRVVFLDIDGVLNCGSSMEGINMDCTKRLAVMVQQCNARIVLSSTWRCSEMGRIDILTALVKAGLLQNCIVGQTPEVSEQDMCAERAREICEWLDSMPSSYITSWLVFDDMDLWSSPRLQGHFVQTDVRTGLTDVDVAKGRSILLGEV